MFKNRLSNLESIFDPILVSTWLHFSFQNLAKSIQTSILRGIKKMIDFEMDFLTILAPFWDPNWGHVGFIFGQNQREIYQNRSKNRVQDGRRLGPPPRHPPDAPRCLQDAPKTSKEDSKTTPSRPKTPPRWPQDAPETSPGRPKTLQDAPRPSQDAPEVFKSTPRHILRRF